MGLFDGPVNTSFPSAFGATASGIANNAAASNEAGFNLGHVMDNVFNLAGQVIPAYLTANAAKSAAKQALPVGLLVIGGIALVLLLRK